MTHVYKDSSLFFICDSAKCDETVFRLNFYAEGWDIQDREDIPKHYCQAHNPRK